MKYHHGRTWEKVGVDLFTLDNKDYLITVDYYSNYWEVDRLTNTKTAYWEVDRLTNWEVDRLTNTKTLSSKAEKSFCEIRLFGQSNQ